MGQIGSYNSPIKSIDGELIIEGKINSKFDLQTVISKKQITGTVRNTGLAIHGTGTNFMSEVSNDGYIMIEGILCKVNRAFSDTYMAVLSPGLGNASFNGVDAYIPKVEEAFEVSIDGEKVFEIGQDREVSFFDANVNIIGDGKTLRFGVDGGASYFTDSGLTVHGQLSADTINGTLGEQANGSTHPLGDNSTKIATTEFVRSEIISLLQENGLID